MRIFCWQAARVAQSTAGRLRRRFSDDNERGWSCWMLQQRHRSRRLETSLDDLQWTGHNYCHGARYTATESRKKNILMRTASSAHGHAPIINSWPAHRPNAFVVWRSRQQKVHAMQGRFWNNYPAVRQPKQIRLKLTRRFLRASLSTATPIQIQFVSTATPHMQAARHLSTLPHQFSVPRPRQVDLPLPRQWRWRLQ